MVTGPIPYKKRVDYAKVPHKPRGLTQPSRKGLLEICYQYDLAIELFKAINGKFWDDSFVFAISVNHVLLRKCHVNSKLPLVFKEVAKWAIDKKTFADAIFSEKKKDITLLAQMQHVMDTYVADGCECPVNISSQNRRKLLGKRSAIESAQAAQAFVSARDDVIRMGHKNILQNEKELNFGKKLSDALYTDSSPTEDALKELLKKLGVTEFDF